MKDSIHLVFEYCSIDLATLIDNMYIGIRFLIEKINILEKMRSNV